jgi:AcrR family transcriptional regulator
MPRPAPDRDALCAGLAAHVLRNGLAGASLRPMAAAVGTSDRMLIYHFGSKDALIAEVLDHLARHMAAGLEAALPEQRFATEAALISAVVPLLRAPEVRPFVRLWFDILSAGASGGVPAGTGAAVLAIYRDWIARRHPQGAAGADAALALVEGLLVLDTAGDSAAVDRILSGLAARG